MADGTVSGSPPKAPPQIGGWEKFKCAVGQAFSGPESSICEARVMDAMVAQQYLDTYHPAPAAHEATVAENVANGFNKGVENSKTTLNNVMDPKNPEYR